MEKILHYFNEDQTLFVTKKIMNGFDIISENKTSYTPASNVSNLSQDIQNECAERWTQEVTNAFFEKVNAL